MTPNPATDEPRSVDTVSTTDASGVLYTHYIEPELRTKTIPRRVRLTDAKQVARRWLWSIVIVCVLLAEFLTRTTLASFADTKDSAIAFAKFGIICAFAFAMFACGLEYAWGRERRLLQEGVAVRGVVINGQANYDGDGGYNCWLTYSYGTGNRSHQNSVSVTRQVYEAHTQGNPYLTVLYDAAKPENSKPYFQIRAACFEAPTIV